LINLVRDIIKADKLDERVLSAFLVLLAKYQIKN